MKSSTMRVSFEASIQQSSKKDASRKVPEEPTEIRAVLKDEGSRSCIEDQKKHLQQMVSKQRTSLRSLLGCNTNNGSLRSLLSEKIDQNSSLSCFKNFDNDFTDETEDLTESFAGHNSSLGKLQFDFDEEQKMLDFLSEREDEYHVPEPAPPATQKQTGSVEVTPGVEVTLRSAPETWQAIKYGCTIQTSCHGCGSDLHVIEDAAHVVCPDCWMIGPVEQSIGGIPLEFDGASDNHGLGLGVKASDLLQWIDSTEDSL